MPAESERPRVLVTRTLLGNALERLADTCDVELHTDPDAIPRPALLDRIRGVHAAVTLLTDRIDAEVLDAAGPQLAIVANVAVGYNNIDLDACRSRGVVVTNTPDVLTNACADFTWSLILAVTRRLGEGERMLRRREWRGWALDQLLGMELRGKQLGIVGLGRIGAAVAAKAPAFGMQVAFSGDDPMPVADAVSMPLDRLLATSDVVSLHCPLTPETRHLIDEAALASMKRTAYLINTSRGPVVDEAALARALRNRTIAGAALDVYEREPEIDRGFFDLENALLIPHLASATTETRSAMSALAVDNVLAVLAGRPALTRVA